MKNKTNWLAVIFLITGLFTTGLAGAVGGPKHDRQTVGAHKKYTYKIEFKGGEVASVNASSDDVPLTLKVVDQAGNSIGQSESECLFGCGVTVNWKPTETATYIVVVENDTNESCVYDLNTN